MKRIFWRTNEIAILREHYPASGVEGCAKLLPSRSRQAIYNQAFYLGLQKPRQTSSIVRAAKRLRMAADNFLRLSEAQQ